MTTLFEKSLSPENIKLAWRLSRNNRTLWSPEVSAENLASNSPFHLLKLVDELKKGDYRPLPTRKHVIAKGDGKHRLLSAPYLRDKFAQRLMLQVIEPLGEAVFHENSFAYRPGRGVADALFRVREIMRTGMGWVVDADIERFFDNIPQNQLKKILKKVVKDKQILHTVDLWLKSGAHASSIFGCRKGIPQGAVISPFLCNIYLHQFDKVLVSRNINFVRYADDFLLFATEEKDAKRAHDVAALALSKLKLELHPEKTKIRKAGPSVVFLGKKLPKFKRVIF